MSPAQFTVSPSSGVPIYRQIIDQVQALLAGGHARPGEMLPSVRELGAALGVNMMTISKAYARLEAEGIVERARGKGMVICQQQHSGTLQSRQSELSPHAIQLAVRGRQLGLHDEQIHAVVQEALDDHPGGDESLTRGKTSVGNKR